MDNFQLVYLFLCWLFIGMLTSHIAKKRGKHPRVWFVLGIALGLIGLALLLLLPKGRVKGVNMKRAEPMGKKMALMPPQRSDSHLKRWYYLDAEHRQVGPMEFTDLTKVWQNKELARENYIWSEGMDDWKKVEDLPDLEKELKKE